MHNHWLYITLCLDVFATSLLEPFLAVHLQEAGFERLMVGLLISVYPMVQLLSSPAAGFCSDLCGCKHTLLCSLLASAVAYYGFGTASYALSIFFWRITLGLLKHTLTLCKCLLVVISDKPTSQFGVINAAEAFGFMLGPIVGAHLIEMEISFTFLCNITSSIFFINALIVFYCFSEDKYQSLTKKQDNKSEYMVVNKYQEDIFADWTIFWDIFVLKWFLCVSLSVFYINFAFITIEQFKMAPRLLGYTNSFQGLVSVMTAIVSVNINNGSFITEFHFRIKVWFFILSISFLCSGLATNFFAFIFCLVPLNISSTLLRMYSTEALLNRASRTNRGTLIGLENTISSIAFVLSPIIIEIYIMFVGSFAISLLPSSLSSIYIIFLFTKNNKYYKI